MNPSVKSHAVIVQEKKKRCRCYTVCLLKMWLNTYLESMILALFTITDNYLFLKSYCCIFYTYCFIQYSMHILKLCMSRFPKSEPKHSSPPLTFPLQSFTSFMSPSRAGFADFFIAPPFLYLRLSISISSTTPVSPKHWPRCFTPLNHCMASLCKGLKLN